MGMIQLRRGISLSHGDTVGGMNVNCHLNHWYLQHFKSMHTCLICSGGRTYIMTVNYYWGRDHNSVYFPNEINVTRRWGAE